MKDTEYLANEIQDLLDLAKKSKGKTFEEVYEEYAKLYYYIRNNFQEKESTKEERDLLME